MNVRYRDDGSKELNACMRFFLHMVYLLPKQNHCYSQITCTRRICTHIYILQWRLSVNPPLAFVFASSCSPCMCQPFPVNLLGDLSSCARGANIHPPSSLVSYQLFPPCCLTHPKDTSQIKLHIYIDDINNISHPVWYSEYLHHCKRKPAGQWWEQILCEW